MRICIPSYYDSEKDKILLDWLRSKNGMSSTIRNALYEKMNMEIGGIQMVKKENPPPPVKEVKQDTKFDNSIKKFIKR